MKNKEYGSDFHYINQSEFRLNDITSAFFNEEVTFQFSGRVSLRHILIHGVAKYNWKKFYIPSYYCQEVYEFISDINIELEFYQCNPLNNEFPLTVQDHQEHVLLIVNYFGVSKLSFTHFKNIATIEDLTHDLSLINNSKADYVFGSLRKVLPVPVGGFIKSKDLLPALGSSLFSEEVALEKLTGMLLKKQYLEGEFKNKDSFRKLLIDSENRIENKASYSELPKLVKEYLLSFNVDEIIDSKKKNSLLIKSLILDNGHFKLLASNEDLEYALILKFKHTEIRDLFRNHLISKKIFPFILWPNQGNEQDQELESTLLFIHIDFRYSLLDMEYIANIINQFN